jgi:DNA-binding PadR family transcriptional regulator
MEGEGYLSAYWEGESESTHRGPRRRYYEVTGAGAHALNDYWDQLQTAGRALRMKPEPAS